MLFEIFKIFLYIPICLSYNALVTDRFLNSACEQAKGIELVADTLLIPYQYALMGQKTILLEDETWAIEPRFNYTKKDFWIVNSLAWCLAPMSLVVGGTLKSLAYASSEMRERYSHIMHPPKFIRIKPSILR